VATHDQLTARWTPKSRMPALYRVVPVVLEELGARSSGCNTRPDEGLRCPTHRRRQHKVRDHPKRHRRISLTVLPSVRRRSMYARMVGSVRMRVSFDGFERPFGLTIAPRLSGWRIVPEDAGMSRCRRSANAA